MDQQERTIVLEQVKAAHSLVEKAYMANGAKKGDEDWLNKRRLLLADLSLHLVQASVQEQTDLALIKRYLYSILTICHEFIPEAELSLTAEKLLAQKS